MSTKSEDYRRKAEEAEAKAHAATDLTAKRMYQDLADHYRYLAGQYERNHGTAIPADAARLAKLDSYVHPAFRYSVY
jgi:hypothetical protein